MREPTTKLNNGNGFLKLATNYDGVFFIIVFSHSTLKYDNGSPDWKSTF
jgi:hypothetical protein